MEITVQIVTADKQLKRDMLSSIPPDVSVKQMPAESMKTFGALDVLTLVISLTGLTVQLVDWLGKSKGRASSMTIERKEVLEIQQDEIKRVLTETIEMSDK